MKKKLLLLSAILTASASATVTIQGNYGDLYNNGGAVVGNNTLFILVASSTGTFYGGFGVNTSLATADTFTEGQAITLGANLNVDNTIFYIGGTNGSVAEVVASGLPLAGNVLAGKNYAIYWFPGATYDNVTPANNKVGLQAGGYNNTTGAPSFSLDGMVIPPDGSDVNQGFVTVSAGGTTANSAAQSFTGSVTPIPEPSAALLGAIGALGLLRRRRI